MKADGAVVGSLRSLTRPHHDLHQPEGSLRLPHSPPLCVSPSPPLSLPLSLCLSRGQGGFWKHPPERACLSSSHSPGEGPGCPREAARHGEPWAGLASERGLGPPGAPPPPVSRMSARPAFARNPEGGAWLSGLESTGGPCSPQLVPFQAANPGTPQQLPDRLFPQNKRTAGRTTVHSHQGAAGGADGDRHSASQETVSSALCGDRCQSVLRSFCIM